MKFKTDLMEEKVLRDETTFCDGQIDDPLAKYYFVFRSLCSQCIFCKINKHIRTRCINDLFLISIAFKWLKKIVVLFVS